MEINIAYQKGEPIGAGLDPPLSAISKNERPRCARECFPTLPLFDHEGTK